MAKEITTTQAVNLLTEGTTIVGDIETKNDIRIDGLVKGKIKTSGRLVIGNSGCVEGDINCVNVDIIGKVVGNIVSRGLVSLKSPAQVIGDINTQSLSVEPGVTFNGSCKMDAKGQSLLTSTSASTATAK